MKLFVAFINTKKSIDVRPGEQAVILPAENVEAAREIAGKLVKTEWPIVVEKTNYVYALGKDISLMNTPLPAVKSTEPSWAKTVLTAAAPSKL